MTEGTTRLDNGMIRYDCCGETGGTPRITHIENTDTGELYESYRCPHCGADQGEREIQPGTMDDCRDEPYARALNEVGT